MAMLLRPYAIIFMNVCVVLTLAMAMLLRPYAIIFMNVCVVLTLAMAMLLRDIGPYDHSSMVHYVHVLLYNTAQIL
jgi:4-hydroxybenzoate polyprenyltransferase